MAGQEGITHADPLELTMFKRLVARTTATAAGALALLALASSLAPAGAEPMPYRHWAEVTTGLQVNGTYEPLVGNFAGSGHQDIFWYAPGAGSDQLWTSNGDRTFAKRPSTPQMATAGVVAVIGDFAGDTHDDIYWYGRGPTADTLWIADGAGAFRAERRDVLAADGRAENLLVPVTQRCIAYLDGERQSDKDNIIWFNTKGGAGSIQNFYNWEGASERRAMTTPAETRPVLVGQNNCQDVLWYRPGPGTDVMWDMSGWLIDTSVAMRIDGSYIPVVADFSTPRTVEPGRTDWSGAQDILWYSPTGASSLWERSARAGWVISSVRLPAGKPMTTRTSPALVHVWETDGSHSIWQPGVSAAEATIPITNTSMASTYKPIVGDFAGAVTPPIDGGPNQRHPAVYLTGADIFWYAPGATTDRLFA